MSTIQNKQKISSIVMKPVTRCFCPLGDAWYTSQFEVVFNPAETIPDYCDVDRWIKENIDGKSLIIEDAVSALYDYLLAYNPAGLHVIADVKDAGHFPVEVYKQ